MIHRGTLLRCVLSLLVGVGLTGCAGLLSDTDDATVGSLEAMNMNDPYIWLEDIDSERSLDWVRAQNRQTLEALKSQPLYEEMFAQALDIYTTRDRLITGEPREGYLYNFWQDNENPQGIWRRAPLDSFIAGAPQWDVLFDLDAFNREKGSGSDELNWVWHGVECLRNSPRCLMALSLGGLDADVVREYDLITRSFVDDGFYLPQAKQEIAWVDRDTLLVSTDRGEGSMTASGYPRTVVRWVRGTNLEQAEEVFSVDEKEIGVYAHAYASPEGHQPVITRSKTFFKKEYYAVVSSGELVRLPAPEQADLKGFHRGQVILGLNEDWTVKAADREQTFASGSLVSYSLAEVESGGEMPVVHEIYRPDDSSALQGAVPSGGALYIATSENVSSRTYRAQFNGIAWQLDGLALPDNGTVDIISTDDVNDNVLFRYENFLTPDSLYFARDGGELRQIASLPEWFDTTGLTVSQRYTTSADGTRVPYYLIHRADVHLDGSTPTLLYGYGGFQISYTPFYSGGIGRLWLERGGAYALANIRGGGEFGPSWHQAALKNNRQRAFDDFIAVAEDLIETGITSPPHLGIQGGSNGGLLVGTVVTQRPDLFGAVVCQVPLLDMMRYHLLLAGASWVGEYGDPDIPEQRTYLARYSPYQRLDPDADYPRIYIYTSTRDDRVHPAHARKFVARMKEQGHPVYYFERIEGGHSAGANLQQAAETVTLTFAYLWSELGSRGNLNDQS